MEIEKDLCISWLPPKNLLSPVSLFRVQINTKQLLCLVIDFEMKFSGFLLFEEPRKKLKNAPLAAFLRPSFYVVKSFADYQKWWKIRFGTKDTST